MLILMKILLLPQILKMCKRIKQQQKCFLNDDSYNNTTYNKVFIGRLIMIYYINVLIFLTILA